MHDESCAGSDYFKCDFCLSAWADDRPMVEGHRGSLICSRCLTVAYGVAVSERAPAIPAGAVCVLCLEHRDEGAWESPARPGVFACRRCVKQSARVLAKDPEAAWSPPAV